MTVLLTPQTSVVPTVPTVATGPEIALPFQIDSATGGVAVLTSNVDVMFQHVATILNTEVGERVMEEAYGTHIRDQVFSNVGGQVSPFLTKDIEKALAAWEPSIIVNGVSVQQNKYILGELDISVSFSIAPLIDANTVTVTIGGAVLQMVSP